MANFVLPANSKQWKTEKFSSKTTTAYDQGELVYNDGTNTVPGTTTNRRMDGICQDAKAVGATATTSLKYLVPREPNAGMIMDVGTGTIAKTDEGQCFDLTSSTTVNANASTYSPVKLIKFLSTTKGIFVFNYEIGVDA